MYYHILGHSALPFFREGAESHRYSMTSSRHFMLDIAPGYFHLSAQYILPHENYNIFRQHQIFW